MAGLICITAIDNFSGQHAHLNLMLLLMKWTFFEAKTHGIFSMLFGAGVVLMTQREQPEMYSGQRKPDR